MLHTRALLHATNGQPLTGAVDLDILGATRGRRHKTLVLNDELQKSLEPDRSLAPGQAPPARPAYVLPLLWNRAVMLEAGGDLLEAQEAFLELQRLLPDVEGQDEVLAEFGLRPSPGSEVDPESPAPLVLQHFVALLRGQPQSKDPATKQAGDVWQNEPVPPRDELGRLDFQVALPGALELLPHSTLATHGFDFTAATEQSLERLRNAQATHAEKRLVTHKSQASKPAKMPAPAWHEKHKADVSASNASLLHNRGGVRPKAPETSKDGIGVVRRQTGLRMALPIITSNS